MEFYIRLIWEFQSVVEDRMEAVPNEKGVRAFSLFPVSTSFTKLHIVINGTTLAGFVSRIRDRGQGNLMEDWDMPQVKISTASFKVMRWTVMRRAFGIDRFETRKEECPLSKTEFLQLPVEEKYEHASHLFANEIKSDGYSASVLYYRPKHEELGGEDDSLLPEGYSPDVVIGLDPGMRSLCTAARKYLRLQAPRRRSRRKVRRPRRKNRKKGRSKRKLRRKRNFPKWIRRAKRARHRNNRDIVSVTTREYRQASGRVQPLPRLERESEEEVPGLQECDRRNAVVQDLELREVPEAAGSLLAARGVPAEVLSGAAVPEVALLPEENGSRCGR
ncbi:hypothetical protein PC119_g6125 [Phytophthora cactorum]|uniref:Uncharacterized protein n=1 Tax=Phytophthora cactorum TaxID=29920 RepID=A0A8T1E995_9STRA|nr:hypothetical protein PC117_g6269 [Phytophthora cactorum]KAG3030945.1 hypothetical protein PC119_g6125 [Phytophthora cactorum]